MKELFSFKQAGIPRWLIPPPPGRLGVGRGPAHDFHQVPRWFEPRSASWRGSTLLRRAGRVEAESTVRVRLSVAPEFFFKSHSDERGAKGPKTSLTGCGSLAFPEVEATLL